MIAAMTELPDPDQLHPVPGMPRVVHLRPLIAAQSEVTNVTAGRFSYYDDPVDATGFLARNVLYNFGYSGARLTIGSFCAIASGARFMMPDAMHPMGGVSTFPFAIFGGAFAAALDLAAYPFPPARDTVVGHDVWIGMEALVLPGLRIGHGAVVAARSVVTQDVPDYAIVAGNPARIVRRRHDEDEAARLVALAWWDWPLERIVRVIPHLLRGPVSALEDMAR
jgi:virginiamycin A acetyltransferase